MTDERPYQGNISANSQYRDAARGHGRLNSLLVREKGLEISVPEGFLPAFIERANTFVKSGDLRQARIVLLAPENIDTIQRRVSEDPNLTDLMYVYARLLMDIGALDHAEDWLQRILRVETHHLIYNDLGAVCLQDPGRHTEAAGYLRRAYEGSPEDPDICACYGRTLMCIGQMEQGIALLRRAVDLAPDDPFLDSMLLWYLHYVPGPDRAFFFKKYQRWGRHFPVDPGAPLYYPNIPDPERPIRVGFLSADYREGSVSRSFELFLDGYDPSCLEVIGYGRVKSPDATTERLKGKFAHYRDIWGQSDAEVTRRIREDAVDVLVELGGHCHDNPLGVMALRPAPVQVDFIGIDTSGLSQMDYRITDDILDPSGTERFYGERLVRLLHGVVFYVPPRTSPVVTPLPAKRKGYVTFGSFNNNLKINPLVMSLCARVLKANPLARLVIKCAYGSDPGVRSFYLSHFQQLGIEPERIDVIGYLPYQAYLELCAQIDLALDTYPFNGCITTMEALWMGIPIVTLTGNTYVARMGLAILTRLGLNVFAACHPDEYVAKTNAFAQQLDELEAIRLSLRRQMLDSPLCRPGRLGTELEQALRVIWRQWCRDRAASTTAREVHEPCNHRKPESHLLQER